MVLIAAATLCVAGDSAPTFTAVRPLLEEHCLRCHAGDKAKGGLDLTTRERLLAGGTSGAAVVPGDAGASRLWRQTAHREEPYMPPRQKALPPAAQALITAWIDAGVPYDRRLVPPPVTDNGPHWAFRPLSASTPPKSAKPPAEWPRSPIDAFLLAALDEAKLAPTPAAGRERLLRRVTVTLIGLPPTPEELAAVRADRAEDWYERVVDRLLASPHFGERWARHWLDVARYAESDGYESDGDRPGAWHYRDAVIRAFAEDLPFDHFVRRQLAGDELEPDQRDAIASTGFLTSGPLVTTSGDGTPRENAQNRANEIDDMVSTTAAAFLGLTVGCARCHDHKFDPIPTRDYYRLSAAFTTTMRVGASWRQGKEGSNDEGPRTPLRIADRQATPAPTWVLARGEAAHRQDEVAFGVLGALTPGGDASAWMSRPTAVKTTFQRSALAAWLCDSDRGAGALTARVLVNRLWQHCFGQGLVRTPNDFGTQGDRPSHPALLDWLAGELRRGGWRMKPLIRLLVTSAAFRQDVTWDAGKQRVDPDERLLWRRRPQRLDAESLRDAILATSGALRREQFGPAIKPWIPVEARSGRDKDVLPRPKEDSPGQWRRSIYLFTKRSLLTPAIDGFDGANPNASCGRRQVSTVSTQALYLMNDPFVRRQAGLFAARLAAAGDDDARLRLAYTLALARLPTTTESAAALRFVRAGGEAGWTDLCHVLFTLNEFAYVD